MGLEVDSTPAEPSHEITGLADTLIVALRDPQAEDRANPKLLSHGNFEKLNETKIILFNFIPCPQNNAQFLRILMEKRIPSNPEDLLPNGEGSKE